MEAGTAAFLKLVRHPVKFPLYLMVKLPSAYFSGVRVKSIDRTACTVTVPYTWFSQNPFRSTYFACLAMAAEMSTGVLSMAYIHNRKPPVSMLIARLEAEYFKKATGKTSFTCEEGQAIRDSIEKAVATGEGQTISVRSTGKNEAGELVAAFTITWSFKSKKL